MPRFIQNRSEIGLIFDRESRQVSSFDFQNLGGRLRAVDGVVSVSDHRDWCGYRHLVIVIQKGQAPQQMLRRMAHALRGAATANFATQETAIREYTQRSRSRKVQPRVVTGVGINTRNPGSTTINSPTSVLSQFFYGALAGGSFVMAWIGLVVPGIPTIPFVILTAVFAAKATPAVQRRLMESRVFGPMIEDWNTYHAIRTSTRNWAIFGTIVVVCLTLIVAPASPTLYVIVGLMAVLTVVFLLRLPIVRETAPTESLPTTGVPSVVAG